MRQIALALIALITLDSALADPSKAEIDATMAKIYAASPGEFQGEWHGRSITAGEDWSSASFTRRVEGTADGRLHVNLTSDNEVTITTTSYVDGGIEYEEGKWNDEPFTEEHKVVSASYEDADDWHYHLLTVFTGSDDLEYEGMSSVIRMGDKQTYIRKLRKKGSDGEYQYSGRAASQRVK